MNQSTPTEQRDLAANLAPTDWKRALAVAEAIDDKWFACQALASVARFAPKDQFAKIIRKSLYSSAKADDPYKIVAASAWPLRAMIEVGETEELAWHITQNLKIAAGIDPPSSRSEALFLLFQSVLPAGRAAWLPVLNALLESSTPVSHWRQRRNARDAILILITQGEPDVPEFLARIDQETRSQIEKYASTRPPLAARPFFWK